MSDLFQIEPNGNVILTHSLIEAGTSVAGGWNRTQLELLGVPWPPIKGWKSRIVEERHEISADDYRLFLAIRETTRGTRNRIIAEFQTMPLDF